MKRLTSFLLSALALLPMLTLAHEGHGHEHPWSPGHFLANPVHSVPLTLAIGLVTVFFVRRYLSTKKAGK